MTILGGNLETKEIGLQIGLSGLHNNTEIDKETGFLKLKVTDVDGGNKPIYAGEGSWLSDPIDLGDNFLDFERVFLTNTDNGASTIAVLTRVSDNGSDWSDWLAIAYDGAIQSDTKRYIQIKVNLFAGFDTDTYIVNKGEYIENNEFVNKIKTGGGDYVVPALTSNTSSPLGFSFAKEVPSSAYASWKAFDMLNTTTYYAKSSYLDGFLGFCFNSPLIVTKYKIKTYLSVTETTTIRDWVLQASNDTITGLDGTWIDLDTQTNQTWAKGEEREYSFKNNMSYKAYRVKWSANNGHTANTYIGGLNFFEMEKDVLQLKRDYEFDMTQDTTWSEAGYLLRKKITREEWLRIDKLNIKE